MNAKGQTASLILEALGYSDPGSKDGGYTLAEIAAKIAPKLHVRDPEIATRSSLRHLVKAGRVIKLAQRRPYQTTMSVVYHRVEGVEPVLRGGPRKGAGRPVWGESRSAMMPQIRLTPTERRQLRDAIKLSGFSSEAEMVRSVLREAGIFH